MCLAFRIPVDHTTGNPRGWREECSKLGPVSYKSGGHGVAIVLQGNAEVKATPAHPPASLALDRSDIGAPVTACLNWDFKDRKLAARCWLAALERCVSLKAKTSALTEDKTWCLPCSPDGLLIPNDHVASAGPGTRASPMRHIVNIKTSAKIALSGRNAHGVTLALGFATGPPNPHSVRGFFAKMASMRSIWSESMCCICWDWQSSCTFICCCNVWT